MRTKKIGKRGEGFITPCIIIVAICMLLSVFLSFSAMVNVVRINKRNVRNCLDAFVTENSIDIYDSLKTGSDRTEFLASDDFISSLETFNSFTGDGDYLYFYDDNGNELYRLTKPRVYFIEEKTLKIEVSYELIIPVCFGERNLSEAIVPITIKSRFENKY